MAAGDSHVPSEREPWPPGRQYQAVRRAIEEEWERCEFQLRESPSFKAKFGFDLQPLSFVLASEWSRSSSHDIAGDLVRAWVRDADGLRAIAKDEYERLTCADRHLEPRHALVMFHVCDDGRHVVYAIGLGPLSGVGGRCWIDPADPRLDTWSWIS